LIFIREEGDQREGKVAQGEDGRVIVFISGKTIVT